MQTLKAPINENYCGTVVQLTHFVDLKGCTNVKAAIIFGQSVIVGKNDSNEGDIGVFFPVETALYTEFLHENNLFREPTLNKNTTKKGYFEAHGRIKCVKFCGFPSEGFFVPLSYFEYLGRDVASSLKVGDTFDEINGQLVCRKHVAGKVKDPSQKQGKPARNQPKTLKSYLVDNQFKFHVSTPQFYRNAHMISADDIISISDKLHGTSAIFSNVKIKRDLNWFENFLDKFGIVPVEKTKYGFVISSRRVIKTIEGARKSNANDYYNEDVWSIVGTKLKALIPKGYTVYGEIVGYTPGGKEIQKDYAYGCQYGTHKFYVYRVTFTNDCGTVIELSWPQMQEFTTAFGLNMVPTLYYGKLMDHPKYVFEVENGLMNLDDSAEDFWLNYLINLYMEKDCIHNAPGIPAEGVVIRKDHLHYPEVYKLKSLRFRERESKLLDSADYVDMEEDTDEELPIAA